MRRSRLTTLAQRTRSSFTCRRPKMSASQLSLKVLLRAAKWYFSNTQSQHQDARASTFSGRSPRPPAHPARTDYMYLCLRFRIPTPREPPNASNSEALHSTTLNGPARLPRGSHSWRTPKRSQLACRDQNPTFTLHHPRTFLPLTQSIRSRLQ